MSGTHTHTHTHTHTYGKINNYVSVPVCSHNSVHMLARIYTCGASIVIDCENALLVNRVTAADVSKAPLSWP